MTFEQYLQQLGYTTYGDDNMRYKDASGESVSPQALEQLQGNFNQFNQTDAQGRPVYGTEAYQPGTMSGAYDAGLFRLGQADAGPQLQPILDQMGASVQYDPRYGYVIPQAAQDQWSQQYGQPTGFDAFMENLASNMPITLGGAVLGAGAGVGPLANASTISGGPLIDAGSWWNNFTGGATGAGGSSVPSNYWNMLADAGGTTSDALSSGAGSMGDIFDLVDNWDSSLMGDLSAYGLGGDSGGFNLGGWGTDETGALMPDERILGGTGGSNWLSSLLPNGISPGMISSLLGGGLQGLGAYAGAGRQADAATAAAQAQMQMFNTLNQQSAPWRQAGQQALGTIGSMMPDFTRQFTNADLNSQLAPNFQFMLDKGVNATKNALNVGNGLVSGNTIQGINDYAQNYAGNAYQNAFNNWNAQQSNIFNRLANIAGLGQTANQTTAGAGTNLANSAGTNIANAGAASGGGLVGATNAVTGGLNNALGWYMLPQFLNYGNNVTA